METDKTTPLALALNVTLSFLAGYVDAVGFMALFGLFTAHITGNLVLLGAEMATPGHTFPILKILVFPAFVGGVVLATMITMRCHTKGHNALLVLYLVEMLMLVAFMTVGVVGGPIEANMSSAAILAGVTGAMAMGVHSACGRLLLPDLAPTAMMTGNVTQVVIEFIGPGRKTEEGGTRGRWAKYLWPIVAFGVGAFAAAFAYFQFEFRALLLPIVLVLVLACIETWKQTQS